MTPHGEIIAAAAAGQRTRGAYGIEHGAAFAGALKEIGLPEGNIPAALLMFNVGVEIGQLLFVLAVTAVLAMLRCLSLPARAPRWGEAIATYAIGSFSAFGSTTRSSKCVSPESAG